MKVMKIFVDDKSYDTEDGFTLYSDDAIEIDVLTRICLENGFQDIRISPADADEIVEYSQTKGEFYGIFNNGSKR